MRIASVTIFKKVLILVYKSKEYVIIEVKNFVGIYAIVELITK